MRLDDVTPGYNPPNDINVIIEIPTQSNPVKYEVDKATGALFVDRFLNTAMFYPCNYGYLPHSLSEDGDPVDILVIAPYPVISGSVIRCRPIGMLNMTDESGPDSKILAVPLTKLTMLYQNIKSPQDVSPHLLSMIEHFFAHYKDLEPEKWVRIDGWSGAESAEKEIKAGLERYQTNPISESSHS
ncbi:MAG: Inorganic pyrophosphatase [Legionellaceae bacterium]